MTEQEWREGTDLDTMLDFLRDKASDRKLRLIRRTWEKEIAS